MKKVNLCKRERVRQEWGCDMALLDRLPQDTPCKFSSPPTTPHVRYTDMTRNRKGLDKTSFWVRYTEMLLGNLTKLVMALGKNEGYT